MSQRFSVSKLEWLKDTSQINEDFIKHYNKESVKGYFIEADLPYPDKLHELYNNLQFVPERMKLGKIEELVANLHDKTDYTIHIRNLKQALNIRLFILKKFVE